MSYSGLKKIANGILGVPDTEGLVDYLNKYAAGMSDVNSFGRQDVQGKAPADNSVKPPMKNNTTVWSNKELNNLVAQRKNMQQGGADWVKTQNRINQLLGSNVVHKETPSRQQTPTNSVAGGQRQYYTTGQYTGNMTPEGQAHLRKAVAALPAPRQYYTTGQYTGNMTPEGQAHLRKSVAALTAPQYATTVANNIASGKLQQEPSGGFGIERWYSPQGLASINKAVSQSTALSPSMAYASTVGAKLNNNAAPQRNTGNTAVASAAKPQSQLNPGVGGTSPKKEMEKAQALANLVALAILQKQADANVSTILPNMEIAPNFKKNNRALFGKNDTAKDLANTAIGSSDYSFDKLESVAEVVARSILGF